MRRGPSQLVATASALALALACDDGQSPADCTQKILASNYDQSCERDSDCVDVGGGSVCFPCLFVCASGGVINVRALARFNADVAASPAGPAIKDTPFCGCPEESFPCCVAGMCQANEACAGGWIADAGGD